MNEKGFNKRDRPEVKLKGVKKKRASCERVVIKDNEELEQMGITVRDKRWV